MDIDGRQIRLTVGAPWWLVIVLAVAFLVSTCAACYFAGRVQQGAKVICIVKKVDAKDYSSAGGMNGLAWNRK